MIPRAHAHVVAPAATLAALAIASWITLTVGVVLHHGNEVVALVNHVASVSVPLCWFLSVVVGHISYRRAARRVRACDYQLCIRCAHDLRGLSNLCLCPECGRRANRRCGRRRWRRWAAFCRGFPDLFPRMLPKPPRRLRRRLARRHIRVSLLASCASMPAPRPAHSAASPRGEGL